MKQSLHFVVLAVLLLSAGFGSLNANPTKALKPMSLYDAPDSSQTVYPKTGCTPLTMADLPYTTGFESTDLDGTNYPLPNCWTRYNTGSVSYYPYSCNIPGNITPHTGSYALYFHFLAGANYGDTVLAIMPPIDTSVSMANLKLSFYASGLYFGGGSFDLGVMSDPTDPMTFTSLQSYQMYNSSYSQYTFESFVNNAGHYIAFRVLPDSYLSNYFGIDDVALESNVPIDNLTVSACDSYDWGGTTLTASGVYTNTYTTANGGDSIVNLYLTIYNSTATDVDTSACDMFIWNGRVYTTSAVDSMMFSTSHGCDSLVRLNLALGHNVTIKDTLSLNVGDLPYDYNGHSIDTAGNFVFHGETATGCDSTVYLHVDVEGLGIDAVTFNNLKVYPNPTQGVVTVDAENVLKIEVLDITGRCLSVFTGTKTVDLSLLPQGSYILRITMPQGTTVRRVVKR